MLSMEFHDVRFSSKGLQLWPCGLGTSENKAEAKGADAAGTRRTQQRPQAVQPKLSKVETFKFVNSLYENQIEFRT